MKALKNLSIVIGLMTISFIIGLKLQSKPNVTELRTLQADSFEGEPTLESVDSLEFNLNQ